jgi:hypothetical protein
MKASSILPLSTTGGHSAQVEMRLLVNGCTLEVAQMGSDYVLLETPIDHPPADACMVMIIDQRERRWDVRLPAGISARTKQVAIAPCP